MKDKIRCPDCKSDKFTVYSTDPPYECEGGKKVVRQHRRCQNCGCTGITTYEKWVCEFQPATS